MIKHTNSRKTSILRSLLFNSILVTFILLTAVNALIFSFVYAAFKSGEEKDIQKNLDNYSSEYKIVENNAATKSNYVAQNLNIIDLLNSDTHDAYEKFENSLEITAYIKPLIDNSVKSITIFSENTNLFPGEYIRPMSNLEVSAHIRQKLKDSQNLLYIDSDFLSDSDNRLYFSLYRQLNIGVNTVLQINMYLPNLSTYSDSIFLTSNAADFKENNYLFSPLNEIWYAASDVRSERLASQRLFYLLLFLFFEVILLLISVFVTKKINQKTINSVNQLVEYASLNYKDPQNTSFWGEISQYQEIEQIKNSMQSLILKIQKISDEKAAVEFEKKEVSLKLLQSKLNPHFLYNILSVISYREMKNNNTETCKIINELIAYYRMILSKGKDSITLEEELELIKKYVFLAEISHSKHYDLSIDIDPSMNNIVVPHMLLQPFVENSIIHGLSGSREDCRIIIKVSLEDNFVVFTVFDNGYGMNNDALTRMNNLSEKSTSYGIKNTYERMQLKYGQDFSIFYKSEFNSYTEATIKIRKSSLLSE